jgi:aryl-alcohol dehydrogenase-like predicted oxidoreductase
MDTIRLAGRETARIGFGCGRLAGGSAARESIRLVEQVRTLGITHFDVAPAYGLGLAEDVLGEALAGDAAVTIATKVGIGRPGHAGLKSVARQLLKPLLSAAPALRRRLGAKAGEGARGQFEPGQVEVSIADSLRRLRRDRVDALLLHQPTLDAISPALVATMDNLVARGHINALGSGTGGDWRDLVPFGSVRQYRWSPDNMPDVSGTAIVHGLLRQYPRPEKPTSGWAEKMAALGFDPADPSAWQGLLLTLALASSPGAIVLISSTDAARVRAAVGAVNWAAVRGEWAEFIPRAGALLLGRAHD